MTMKTETIDTLSNVGSRLTAGGMGFIGFGWLTAELALGIIGAVATLVGLLVNFHYKRKANARRQREYEMNMKVAEEGRIRAAEIHRIKVQMMLANITPPASDFAPLAPAEDPWSQGQKEDDGN
jgi:hypothetical protein